MNENYPIHLIGKICWLPPHRSGKPHFSPATIIRALAKFTSDFGPSYTVIVYYSPILVGQDCYNVRLSFPFSNFLEIERLATHSELLIMDGYKVIAVCRDLMTLGVKGGKIDDPWGKNTEN